MSAINTELLPDYTQYFNDIKLPTYDQVSKKKFYIKMNFCLTSDITSAVWSVKETPKTSTWYKVYQSIHGIKIQDKKQCNNLSMESKIIPDINNQLRFVIKLNIIAAELFKTNDMSYNLIIYNETEVKRYTIIIEKNKYDRIKSWKLMDPQDLGFILASCSLTHTGIMLAELEFNVHLKIHEFQLALISFCQLMSCYYR
ncbi:hypothetical protein K502DRAFT_322430 [Neoconidiobolus thromboides FSU 785]|nr:hypothetical protein K502DRAFT_322430 [Neoconidiobolus thromboides FSU 785]